MNQPESEKFEVGDLVRLKSGGPIMTVESLIGSPIKIDCVWFSSFLHGRRMARDRFPAEALEGA